ncbi:MAG: hydroxyacylglutathione hydrolase [Gammaproteobacteria bacterium]
MEIERIPALSDNYLWLVHEPEGGVTAVVDPAEPEPVMAALGRRGWKLTHILNTHHHPDHVGANLELKRRTGCTIVGPRADRDRIPGIDVHVGEGDRYPFGHTSAAVFDVPGHTRGHIAYWFEAEQALFCGDTLFALGCGRLFEGTPEQMWASLSKLRNLPPVTKVYCAHEYTQSNGRFALSVEPDNFSLIARMLRVDAARERGEATVPSTLIEELATNPFLRPESESLQRTLGMIGADPVAVFAETRRRKDSFRG